MQNSRDFAASLEGRAPAVLMDVIGRELLAVTALLASAEAVQWQAPPRTGAGSGRGGSEVSNPTADTALDGQRLRLRADVIATERGLRDVAAQLRSLRGQMDTALTPYEE